ncbi:MAG: FG-GAP-like repeat-containing protein, partial [Chitinophagaceae bacterium]|nr:FG-GAP-like repeat-containing protein [Chitinophagaceae bacterium]
MKFFLLAIACQLTTLFFSPFALAQPSIASFSPLAAKPGDAVTLSGANFNTSPAGNIVFFGAAKATVTAASATSITATVPIGATYGFITILNTGTGLTGFSKSNFTPIYQPAKASLTSSDFLARVDFAAGQETFNVATGDIDGDGKVDVVVANISANTISVYRNTAASGSIGSGSFAAKVDFATAVRPRAIAIGDLNGDGKPELAVANNNSSSVSVFPNISTPGTITSASFAAKIDYTTGFNSNPSFIALGDLDGDGKPDLATANSVSNNVSVLRNSSAGGVLNSTSFSSKVDFAAGTTPTSIAIGDLDGDGKADLVSANFSSNNISVLRNTATSGSISASSFAAAVNFATASNPYAVAMGDLDGDGKLDLAVANHSSNSVSFYRNTAASGSISSGSFTSKFDLAAGNTPTSVAIGDLNGDGKADVALANSASNMVSVYQNTATTGSLNNSSFAAKLDFVAGLGTFSVAIGDLDGDARPDLVTANAVANNISVFRQVSNNADLSGLTLSTGTLNPVFLAGTTAYTASVPNATTSITVTPTRAETNATIQVRVNNGGYTAVSSGTPSGALSLNPGSNTVEILVTAQNTATKTYSVMVTRENPPPPLATITNFSPIAGKPGDA